LLPLVLLELRLDDPPPDDPPLADLDDPPPPDPPPPDEPDEPGGGATLPGSLVVFPVLGSIFLGFLGSVTSTKPPSVPLVIDRLPISMAVDMGNPLVAEPLPNILLGALSGAALNRVVRWGILEINLSAIWSLLLSATPEPWRSGFVDCIYCQ